MHELDPIIRKITQHNPLGALLSAMAGMDSFHSISRTDLSNDVFIGETVGSIDSRNLSGPKDDPIDLDRIELFHFSELMLFAVEYPGSKPIG